MTLLATAISALTSLLLLQPISCMSLVQNPSKDNSDECDCYLVSGPSPGYFQHHRFFDFRNIPNDDANDYTVVPGLITNSENTGFEPLTAAYLKSTDFTNDWSIQTWSTNITADSPIKRINSPRNIYITRNTTDGSNNSTYLNLRASRAEDFMSTSELENNQMNILYSSVRARFRVLPLPDLSNTSAPRAAVPASYSASAAGSNGSHPVDDGAVAGLFTYESGTTESDIEILTSDPVSNIRWSNQPDYNYHTNAVISGASTDFSLPSDIVWTEWLDHRLDWFPGRSSWWIDGELLLNKTYGVPKKPSGLVLNLWGDGGEWSGNMSVGGSVILAVEWIEVVFNTSGPIDGPNGGGSSSKRRLLGLEKRGHKCKVACRVDGVENTGFPEIQFHLTSLGVRLLVPGSSSGCEGLFMVVLSIVIGSFMFIC